MMPSGRWVGKPVSGKRCSNGVNSMFPSGDSAPPASATNVTAAMAAPDRRRRSNMTRAITASAAITLEGTERKLTNFDNAAGIARSFQLVAHGGPTANWCPSTLLTIGAGNERIGEGWRADLNRGWLVLRLLFEHHHTVVEVHRVDDPVCVRQTLTTFVPPPVHVIDQVLHLLQEGRPPPPSTLIASPPVVGLHILHDIDALG